MARADQLRNTAKAVTMRMTHTRGGESCTLYVRSLASVSSTASWMSYSLGRARFVPPTLSEAGGGVTTSTLPTAAWHVPQASLDAVSAGLPKPGDVFGRSDGTLWLVESVRQDAYQQWHECQTTRYKGERGLSILWDTVIAVASLAGAVPQMVGRTVEIRPAPIYLPDIDTAPLLIISPDPAKWEQIVELTFQDGTNNDAFIDWPVIASVVLANAADVEQSQWLVDLRVSLRKALWLTTLPAVEAVFDCDYVPAPRGVDLSGLSQASFFSVQQFTYRLKDTRL